jgi:hypothetical protein
MGYCSFPLVPLATRLPPATRLQRQHHHVAQGMVHDEAGGVAQGLSPRLLVGRLACLSYRVLSQRSSDPTPSGSATSVALSARSYPFPVPSWRRRSTRRQV